MAQNSFTIVRAVKIRQDLRPLSIHDGATLEPIAADWASIVHGMADGRESFTLNFLSEAGEVLEFLSYETLEIALDQAKAIACIRQDEWTTCSVPSSEKMTWDNFLLVASRQC